MRYPYFRDFCSAVHSYRWNKYMSSGVSFSLTFLSFFVTLENIWKIISSVRLVITPYISGLSFEKGDRDPEMANYMQATGDKSVSNSSFSSRVCCYKHAAKAMNGSHFPHSPVCIYSLIRYAVHVKHVLTKYRTIFVLTNCRYAHLTW